MVDIGHGAKNDTAESDRWKIRKRWHSERRVGAWGIEHQKKRNFGRRLEENSKLNSQVCRWSVEIVMQVTCGHQSRRIEGTATTHAIHPTVGYLRIT